MYELVQKKTEICFYGHNIRVETAEKCRNEEEGLPEAVEAVKQKKKPVEKCSREKIRQTNNLIMRPLLAKI